MTNLHYPDPWAYDEQPQLKILERNWWGRPKLILLLEDYWISVPDWVLERIPHCPEKILIPKRFVCDMRSSPFGVILRTLHPAALPHDLRYGWGEWRAWVWDRGGADLGVMTRRDSDLLFWAHVIDTGRARPWYLRWLHRVAAPLQWAAVRLFGGKAFEDNEEAV